MTSSSCETVGRKKILAISSGGGHFIELLRLRPAFGGHFVVFVTVDEAYRKHVGSAPLHVVRDTTRWDGWRVGITASQVFALLLRERPDVVVSTGALPGFFGVVFGRMLGAQTIWVDSLANVEELSMSGQKVGPFADLWLTQWQELATPGGPRFAGSVLG